MSSPFALPSTWDLVAPAYERHVADFMPRYSGAALERLRPEPEMELLDVACGPGTLSLLAAPRLRRVEALDFSPRMVAELERHIAEEKIGNLGVRLGDGQALPWPDGSFDLAASMFGLIFFPDIDRGLRELHRVLRPGGRAAVGAWRPFAPGSPMMLLMEAIASALPQAPPNPMRWALGTESDMATAFFSAGFDEVEVHSASFELVQPSLDAWWTMITEGLAPLVLMRKHMSEAQWADFSGKVHGSLRAALGEGPVRYAQPALIGVGQR
jgi:SAM-dependent methyltransferase